jgi:mono/diheme cytochrome c family protein
MRLAALAIALVLAGCGVTTRDTPVEVFSDMRRQPKYKPQAASAFFSDGRASRTEIPGTVAAGPLREVVPENYTGPNPLPATPALLARGQERFDIFCAVCHDRTGSGKGIVGQRTSWLPTSLLDERVMKMTDGEIFSVATYGRRTMPPYRFQVPERDRWAIVAYVRALQRARSGKIEDVPPELRPDLR